MDEQLQKSITALKREIYDFGKFPQDSEKYSYIRGMVYALYVAGILDDEDHTLFNQYLIDTHYDALQNGKTKL